jgi:hypothetical protein
MIESCVRLAVAEFIQIANITPAGLALTFSQENAANLMRVATVANTFPNNHARL